MDNLKEAFRYPQGIYTVVRSAFQVQKVQAEEKPGSIHLAGLEGKKGSRKGYYHMCST